MSSTYRLNFSRKSLTDSAIDQVRRELPARKGDFSYEEVDFSQNELTSVGLRVVLEVCCRCPKLRVLKLYKNNLDDGAAKGLADLCSKVPGIEEIHLSHNRFTANGVEVMVSAAEDVRPEGMSPLWLRLEQNYVVEPESVFRDLVQKQLSVCQRVDEVRCTVRTCCKRQKIHLPFFHVQRQPLRGGYPAGPGGPTLPPSISRNAAGAAGSPVAGSPSVSVRTTPKAAPSVSTRPATNGNVWGNPRPAAQSPVASAQKPPEAPERSPANVWGTPAAGSPVNVWGMPATPAKAAATATAPEPEPAAARPAPPRSPPTPPEPAARPAPPQSPPEPAAKTAAAGAGRPDPPDLPAVVAAPPTAAATPAAAATPHVGPPTPKPPPRPDPPRPDTAPGAGAGGGERSSAAAAAATPQARPKPPPRTDPPRPDSAPGADAGGGGRGSAAATPQARPEPPPRPDATPGADAGGGERGSAGERGGAPAAASPDAKKAGPAARAAQPAQEKGQRPSLVLDSRGNRRLHRLQLEVDGASDQFICPICGFWLSTPLMSTCSHLFCQECFKVWIEQEVEKAKKTSMGKVPTISCPQPGCSNKLLKKDVAPFDRGFGESANAGVSKVMQRLRNNIQIRCVHHADHFQHPFGADAKRILQEAGISCRWIGDATSYQEHLKNCPVEEFIASPPVAKVCSKVEVEEASAKVEPQDQGPQGDVEEEVRVVRHDYIPQEAAKTQLELKAQDLVKIFEYTETGWAAGIRVCQKTKAEIGEPGWFPAGYLHPPDYVATA